MTASVLLEPDTSTAVSFEHQLPFHNNPVTPFWRDNISFVSYYMILLVVHIFNPVLLPSGTGSPACNILQSPTPFACKFTQNNALPVIGFTVNPSVSSQSTIRHQRGSSLRQSYNNFGKCVPQDVQFASSVAKNVVSRSSVRFPRSTSSWSQSKCAPKCSERRYRVTCSDSIMSTFAYPWYSAARAKMHWETKSSRGMNAVELVR